MYEKILEIISSKISVTVTERPKGYFTGTFAGQDVAAKAIADMNREFIEYFTGKDSPYAILYGDQPERFATTNKDYTIDELFNFWYREIYKK